MALNNYDYRIVHYTLKVVTFRLLFIAIDVAYIFFGPPVEEHVDTFSETISPSHWQLHLLEA